MFPAMTQTIPHGEHDLYMDSGSASNSSQLISSAAASIVWVRGRDCLNMHYHSCMQFQLAFDYGPIPAGPGMVPRSAKDPSWSTPRLLLVLHGSAPRAVELRCMVLLEEPEDRQCTSALGGLEVKQVLGITAVAIMVGQFSSIGVCAEELISLPPNPQTPLKTKTSALKRPNQRSNDVGEAHITPR